MEASRVRVDPRLDLEYVAARVREVGRLDALRLVHDVPELPDDLERVSLVGEALELGDLLREPVRIDRRPAQPQDLRGRRLADRVVVAPELFVDLLAGPRAD